MRKKNYLDIDYDAHIIDFNGLAVMGTLILTIIIALVSPWIWFWVCYFSGWLAKILIGDKLIEGFALLGITLPLEKIPLLAGILGWIGSFFKSSSVSNNNNK